MGGCSAADAAAEPEPAAETAPVRVEQAAPRKIARPAATPSPVAPPAVAPPAAGGVEEEPLRILVSVEARRLWLVRGGDTLLSAPAGVGSGERLRHGGRQWRFDTPRGLREVLGKAPDPVWVPPDWHYVEVAREHGYALRWLERGRAERLTGKVELVVRGEDAGLLYADGAFEPLPVGEEIVHGGVMYVPPVGTRQRRIPGELGRYKLDLGDGYLIHGTSDAGTVGGPTTHGCIRMGDQELELLYRHVPVGTPVEIR